MISLRKSVLIVDDSIFMRSYLKKLLSEEKYNVASEASNGEEAVIKYKQNVPDFVLLDITMPKVNGLDALKKIKAFDPEAAVVICSSLGQNSLIIEALKNGAKDFIVKPYFGNLTNVLDNIEHNRKVARL